MHALSRFTRFTYAHDGERLSGVSGGAENVRARGAVLAVPGTDAVIPSAVTEVVSGTGEISQVGPVVSGGRQDG